MKGKLDYRILTGGVRLFSPSEVFHENSKIHESNSGLYASSELLRLTSDACKQYESVATINLQSVHRGETVIMRTIRNRRSIREFSGEAICASDLSKILLFSYGQTEEGHHRAAPSAGGLFPLEIYALVLNVESIESGVYHYNVKGHFFECLRKGIVIGDLLSAIFIPKAVTTAGVVIVVSGVFGRSRLKYGERGYRFVLLEAGHVVQDLCLVTLSLGLASCPIGGFIDDKINSIIGLDGVDESAVYLLTVGRNMSDGNKREKKRGRNKRNSWRSPRLS